MGRISLRIRRPARGGWGLVLLILLLAIVAFALPAGAEGPDCSKLEAECWKKCGGIADEARRENCKPPGYSGCALDVVGCGGHSCSWAYSQYWCDMPGYLGCAEGKVGKYLSCVDACNPKFRAGKTFGARLKILAECPKDCYAPFDEGLLKCRDKACKAHCQEEGAADGQWVRYSVKAKAWDHCDCEEIPKTVEPNQPPVADAGEDQTVREGQKVVLSAEGSHDPDGRIVFYYWYWNNKKIAVGEEAQPRTFPVGDNIVTLEVVDNKGVVGRDTVIITVLEKEKPKEDCDAICKQHLDEDARGEGTPPNCHCSCKTGFKPHPMLPMCQRDCEYFCPHLLCRHHKGTHSLALTVVPLLWCYVGGVTVVRTHYG